MKNNILVSGEFVNDLKMSHTMFNETFYEIDGLTKRLSGNADTLHFVISEKLIDVNQQYKGRNFEIEGELRTHTTYVDYKRKIELFVFVKDVKIVDGEVNHDNTVCLIGQICKKDEWRKTYNGRYITDFVLANRRSYGRISYIPAIAWGRNAKYLSRFDIETFVLVSGRLQSREYVKTNADGLQETKVTYELSINNIEVVGDGQYGNLDESYEGQVSTPDCNCEVC